MDQYLIIIFIAVPAVILFLVIFFNKKAVVKRKLKNAVVKPILNFNTGDIAKITGKIEIAEVPLQAPLSGRKCAYYFVHVEQKVSSGKNTHWRTLIKEERSCKYVIRSGYKCAYVDENNLKSYIVQDRKYRSGFRNDATPDLERFLNTHGYKSEGLLGMNKTIRYKEGILEEGEEVAVAGRGEWKFSNLVGLPDIYDRVLVFSSIKGHPVYLSDDPDTIISLKNRS
ncbi:hypothetical protein ACE1ET_04575 [Saccharicrinis sp. FJH62]|uniref:hypothetical protein n=1 Tax=Saccharicrinis sp. FJH62 TaxID=3344657 RepID=UPI0035D4B019